MNLPATLFPTGIRLAVRLQPRASRNGIDGLIGEGKDCRLKLRLTAPPVDNAANQACREFLAKNFKIAKSQVEITGGEKSRDKVFFLQGQPELLLQRLEELLD
ncbi:MAG TPA: hypothetical protein DD435_01535 [Cyanobacteria bacterium UBA8530]|nr:hypothetical protein [Cyanobacteria bacterium UBA8530]